MRLASEPTRKPSAIESGELRLSAFGGGLKRPPSQKELAGILRVTTRHLRRWESAEAAAHRPCSRPYTHADLWSLYQKHGRKGWDRETAARLGLAPVFQRFDEIRFGEFGGELKDDRSMTATLLLRSIAGEDEGPVAAGDNPLPRMFGVGLARAGKAQLRSILDCTQARDILVKAFFEAALVAEAKHVPQAGDADLRTALSA